jgi:hypothetical protein
MRILTYSAALAGMALSLAITAAPASAAPVQLISDSTNFDLGTDVSGIPLDAPDVNAYVAGLAPETRVVIQDSCANYLRNPADTRSPNTLPFCQIVVADAGAPAQRAQPAAGGSVRTFASSAPLVITNPAPRGNSGNGTGGRYNVFPSENDPNYGLNN